LKYIQGARFEVFTALKIQVQLWVVVLRSIVIGCQHFRGPCCFRLYPEAGSSTGIWNVGILPHNYMALQPRRTCIYKEIHWWMFYADEENIFIL